MTCLKSYRSLVTELGLNLRTLLHSLSPVNTYFHLICSVFKKRNYTKFSPKVSWYLTSLRWVLGVVCSFLCEFLSPQVIVASWKDYWTVGFKDKILYLFLPLSCAFSLSVKLYVWIMSVVSQTDDSQTDHQNLWLRKKFPRIFWWWVRCGNGWIR